MTFGPRRQISPFSPGARRLPASSRISISTWAMARPVDPIFRDLAAGLHESVAAAGFGQAVGVDVAGVGEILREGANARFRRFSPPPIAHRRLETS